MLTAGAALAKAKAVVILLHGRGASAEDIMGLAGEMYDERIAYLAPQAAEHRWYPLSFLAPIAENEPALSSALKKVATLVASAENAGVSRERIFFCGFSQGACLSSEFVARNPARLRRPDCSYRRPDRASGRGFTASRELGRNARAAELG